jgi:hypothetical protein
MAKNSLLILQEIFYWLSGVLLLAIVLEIIWPQIILVYFNLNYLAVLWFLSGFVLLIKS